MYNHIIIKSNGAPNHNVIECFDADIFFVYCAGLWKCGLKGTECDEKKYANDGGC